MLPLRTILHPTDFSEQSDYAFWMACLLAQDYETRLIALHVTEPTVIYGEFGPYVRESETDREELNRRLRQLQASDPKVFVEHYLREGDPVEEILRAAEQTRCDLIVMGSHGRTGLNRLLMGSVAEQVMRWAPCPVLVVKSPPPVPSPAPTEQTPESAIA